MNVLVLVNVNVPENVGFFIPGTFTFTFTSTLTLGFASLPSGCYSLTGPFAAKDSVYPLFPLRVERPGGIGSLIGVSTEEIALRLREVLWERRGSVAIKVSQ